MGDAVRTHADTRAHVPSRPSGLSWPDVDVARLARTRLREPGAVATAYAARRRRPVLAPRGQLLIIAADHPARGALRAGSRPDAMADRPELLARLLVALERPGVDGLLAASDVVEDLLLLDALDDKVVFGSMNRGGLQGTAFEVDDRFTAYDAPAIAHHGLDGGKMLLRIDADDPASVRTVEACAHVVSELAERGLPAMVEPFVVRRSGSTLGTDLSTDAVVRSAVVAAGLGTTSAYTWLKLPVVTEPGGMERAAAATTLPVLLLGGEVPGDPEESYAQWEKALALPTVCGLVVGRSLLYPADDDVAAAVDTAAGLLRTRTEGRS